MCVTKSNCVFIIVEGYSSGKCVLREYSNTLNLKSRASSERQCKVVSRIIKVLQQKAQQTKADTYEMHSLSSTSTTKRPKEQLPITSRPSPSPNPRYTKEQSGSNVTESRIIGGTVRSKCKCDITKSIFHSIQNLIPYYLILVKSSSTIAPLKIAIPIVVVTAQKTVSNSSSNQSPNEHDTVSTVVNLNRNRLIFNTTTTKRPKEQLLITSRPSQPPNSRYTKEQSGSNVTESRLVGGTVRSKCKCDITKSIFHSIQNLIPYYLILVKSSSTIAPLKITIPIVVVTAQTTISNSSSNQLPKERDAVSTLVNLNRNRLIFNATTTKRPKEQLPITSRPFPPPNPRYTKEQSGYNMSELRHNGGTVRSKCK
ncbi:unnamed protein product [Orchesella dallaii]|uniref:Uncharacterized protein n=1 Tax=Orchesella dallaii TaxID=48710 RepID=A0ABP1R5L9_9HEXA